MYNCSSSWLFLPEASPSARIPPVEVPMIRSKWLAIDLPPRKRASNWASMAAGKIPLIPPPSIDRIRNGCPAGHGRRSRRRVEENLERGVQIITAPFDEVGAVHVRSRVLQHTTYLLPSSPRTRPAIQPSTARWSRRCTESEPTPPAYADKAAAESESGCSGRGVECVPVVRSHVA